MTARMMAAARRTIVLADSTKSTRSFWPSHRWKDDVPSPTKNLRPISEVLDEFRVQVVIIHL
jgi:hypothetical protein